MGAGISAKQLYRRKYSRLKDLERELTDAGVACRYWEGCLYSTVKPQWFCVGYETLHASNGEVANFVYVVVHPDGDHPVKYGGADGWKTHLAFRTGIDVVKELFRWFKP